MIGFVIFEHTPPRGMIVAGVLVAMGLTLFWSWRYLRLRPLSLLLAGLRVLFLGLLGWCLLQPLQKESSATALKSRFVVLADVSQSMLQPLEDGVPSRWKVAGDLLQQSWTTSIGQQAILEVFPFAADIASGVTPAQAAALTPDGNASQLRDALRKVVDRYRGQTLAGILLLSDGIDTRESGVAWAEAGWPAPIYTVRLEPPTVRAMEPDVRVERVETPRRVVVGWDSKLTATVSGEGTGGRALNVQLVENDALREEQPTQIPAEGGRRDVTFSLAHPVIGNFNYAVGIPPLDGETVTNDNIYVVSVQVVDPKNRLLYVEGPPRFESKFLTRALQSNPAIAPVIFTQGAQQKFFVIGQAAGLTTAMTPEELNQVKIVILGDLDATTLGPERATALVKFVEQGGSLVLLGGPNAWGENGFAATALASLLPLRREGFQPPQEGKFTVAWTAEGRAHPAFAQDDAWSSAPPILTIFPGSELKEGAVVLAETTEGDPVMAAQRFGQGKVVAILTDSLWRWRLESGTEDAHTRFWSQLLDWMTPKESELAKYELDLFAESDQLLLGEPIRLAARLGARESEAVRGVAVVCKIKTPEGRELSFPMVEQPVKTATGKSFPGFGVEFLGQVPGLHTATAVATIEGKEFESPPFSFYLKTFTPETHPRPINTELLTVLATVSGGKFLEPNQVNATLSAITTKGSQEVRVSYASLWNVWPVLACLVGLLSVEWGVRKWQNLA